MNTLLEFYKRLVDKKNPLERRELTQKSRMKYFELSTKAKKEADIFLQTAFGMDFKEINQNWVDNDVYHLDTILNKLKTFSKEEIEKRTEETKRRKIMLSLNTDKEINSVEGFYGLGILNQMNHVLFI